MGKIPAWPFAAIVVCALSLTSCSFGIEDRYKRVRAIDDTLAPKDFVIGVYMQDPATIVNGKTLAQNYKDIGFNTFIGLWNWPDGTDMGGGYAVNAMQTLKDTGMKVYAGHDSTAVDWINAHPEFADTLAGYLLGDEPEMNKVNGNPNDQPGGWKANGDALHAADPTRPIDGNFGKGFALDPWIGYHVDTGSTTAADFAKYVEPLAILSSDFYGLTDPWEPLSSHGIWAYGMTITNDLRYAEGRIVWGVLEASAPWSATDTADGRTANQMYDRMQPELVMPIVWNMVVHGAQGLEYFSHNFSSTPSYWGGLLEPGMPAAMKAANESVLKYKDIIMTDSIAGTTATALPVSVDVATLTKHAGAYTYVFAMGDGNSTYRLGNAVTATIKVAGQTGAKSVDLMTDSRTLTMTDGVITDHFDAYELHIYRIPD